MKTSALTIRLDRALERQLAAVATRGQCADVLRSVLAEHESVIGELILAELRRVLVTNFKVPADRVDAIKAIFERLDECSKVMYASEVHRAQTHSCANAARNVLWRRRASGVAPVSYKCKKKNFIFAGLLNRRRPFEFLSLPSEENEHVELKFTIQKNTRI